MATLLLDKRTGCYYAQFHDKARRPQRKTVSLKTKQKRTAERALTKLAGAFALGQFDPWAPPPEEPQDEREDLSLLGPARDAYLASCAHLKPKTVKTYTDILRLVVEFWGEDFPVEKLTGRHVHEWLDSTKAGDVTRRKYTNHLGYLCRFLVRGGWMAKDISKEVPLRKVPEQAPKAMTREQVDRLVTVISTYVAPRKADYRWLAKLVWFNVHVGLRRGELIHLRWEHIDLERRVLRVANSKDFATKSSKERTIPLCDAAMDVLHQLREERHEGFVFQLHGDRLNHNTLTHYFKRFRRMAGLPEEINVHSMRHTFGTWLAERGVPIVVIQRLMGHSTVTTTERYMNVRADVTEHWVNRAFGS